MIYSYPFKNVPIGNYILEVKSDYIINLLNQSTFYAVFVVRDQHFDLWVKFKKVNRSSIKLSRLPKRWILHKVDSNE